MLAADEILLAAGAAMLCCWAVSKLLNPLRRVPGPRGLPLLGNHFDIDHPAFHQELLVWKEKYGPVMKYSTPSHYVVVLSSIGVAKEALVTRGLDFAGRPPMWRAQEIAFYKSIAFQSLDQTTIEKRKILQRVLGHSDVSPGGLEMILSDELAEFLDEIARNDGKPFDARSATVPFFCNKMATVLYGERYAYDDPIISDVMEMNDAILVNMDVTNAGRHLDHHPWLRFTGLFKEGMSYVKKAEKLRNTFLMRKVKEARATLDPTNIRAALDEFILAKSEGQSERKTPWNDEDLVGMSIDVITGGVETSARAMQAAYLILLKIPGVQEKLHEEIDRVIGRQRRPNVNDRVKMPYAEAFVYELLRYISHLPLGIPKMTMAATTVGGYVIPANTMVLINHWGINHCELNYPRPFEFCPERFLAEDGSLHPSSHPSRSNLLLFGAGRRTCPGEHMGTTRIFILIVSILQRFTLMEDEDLPAPAADPRTYKLDMVLNPPDYFMRAVPRD